MRRVAAIAVFILSVFIFINGASVKAEEINSSEKKKEVYASVKSGDSLSKIATRHKSNYKRIFYANKKIKNPNLIFPGQKLRIPSKTEKLKARPMGESTSPVRSYSSVKRTSYVPKSVPAPNYSAGSTVWDKLAACESGGNWAINTGNGYYGGLQFSLSSWRGVGGSGYPHQASKSEQIRRGEMLRASGGWGHWPACSAKLGLI